MHFRKLAAVILLVCLILCACGSGKRLADGDYTVELTLEGGSGRATVQSPAELQVTGGQMTVTLIWSSSNYDYMLVDGVKYEPVSYEPGSTFQIPLKNLDDLNVIGDTVAMSTPHEVEYSLHFGAVK